MHLYDVLYIYWTPLCHRKQQINGRDHNLTSVTLFLERTDKNGTYYEVRANCSPNLAISISEYIMFFKNDNVIWFDEDPQTGELLVVLCDDPSKANLWYYPEATFKHPDYIVKIGS